MALTDKNRKRIYYIVLTFVILLIEVLIALYVHDNFIRPYVGDMLVVVIVYTFVRIFFPDGVKLLPLYVFIFAALVELLQMFNIVNVLGLEDNTFFRILIGSVFDIKDIICYGAGCLFIACICAVK